MVTDCYKRIVISIHALREEGDYQTALTNMLGSISIHDLREEGDSPPCLQRRRSAKFLSTPSARRATILADYTGKTAEISIHALREEGDAQRS